MKAIVPMRAALADQELFGPLMSGDTWLPWRVLLIAALGEPLTADERTVFERLTQRAQEPLQIVECFVGIVGRRGGKSRAAAILIAYLACLCDYAGKIVVGERPLVLCLAQNQKQAGVVFAYVVGIIESIPALSRMVLNKTQDTLSLSNGVSIEVRPASFRGLRGVTALAVVADESCFWYSDDTSANADTEILNAVRPSLATTGGPLILISSPYARKGETWNLFRRHFGADRDPLILVAQGASRDFNPSLPQRVVDRAMEADPAAAAAEYLAQWRTDIESFVSREVVEAAVIPGRHELSYVRDVTYRAFVDPSGGSADDMTLCVAHKEKETIVIDAIRAVKPPFSPDDVAREFAETLKSYHVHRVRGDRYAGQWPRERFRVHGIEYVVADKPKSDLYREALPILNAGRVELLDNPKLVSQLCNLERRTARGGRDSIDHPRGAHDDVANAVAGVVDLLSGRREQASAAFGTYSNSNLWPSESGLFGLQSNARN